MKELWQESKILVLFFVALTVATVLSYVNLDSDEKIVSARSAEEILKATETKSALDLITEEGKKRTPAAVETPKRETLKADIFCESSGKARFKKVPQSLVMLDMKVCPALKSNRHIWVKNMTNGFKAQVFKTGEQVFRTDFIQLNPGTNKVMIESVLKDGQKRTQSLEIISGS